LINSRPVDGKKMLEDLKKLNHALNLFDCENTDDGDDDNNNNNNNNNY
jgi:hypothetical protein